jgi:hypothetical protein
MIERARVAGFTEILDMLEKLSDDLRSKDDCSFQCSGTRLGCLIKYMEVHGLTNLKHKAPYEGHSIQKLSSTLSEFSTAETCQDRISYGFYRSCNLQNNIKPLLDNILKEISDTAMGYTLDAGE